MGVFLKIVLFLVLTPTLSAQEKEGPPPEDEARIRYSAAQVSYFQFESDMEDTGEFSSTRHMFRFGAMKPFSHTTMFGLSLDYDLSLYDFSDTTPFGVRKPWDDVQRFGVSTPLIYGLSEELSLMFAPSIDFQSETSADLEDGMGYGAMAMLDYTVNSDLKLGFGAAAYRQVEDSNAFPFITIDWKISDQLQLTNPLQVGPTGPAGLELVYALENDWYLGAGGAFRYFRFRLDDKGVAPDGVGAESGAPTWVRLSKEIVPGFQIDLYLGYTFAGRLRLETEHGNRIASEEYDPAPFAAITVSGRF